MNAVEQQIPSPAQATLASLCATYQTGHLPRLAPKTQAAYRSVIRRALAALPTRPTGIDVATWHDAERARVADVHANYELRVLQSVVRRAVELEGAGLELLTAIKAVKAQPNPPRKPQMPPADFFERTVPAARNRAERAFLGLVAKGPRKGEMLGLLPEDVAEATRFDDDGNPYTVGVITICRQRGRPHRKNRISYVVEVDAGVLADLRWSIENRTSVLPRFGRWNDTPTSAGCVFPWGETYLEYFLARVRDHLGADVDRYLPRRKAWHQYRRRMARDAKERGESGLQIADRLGDKSEAMARTYSDDGEMRNALPAPTRRVGGVALVVRWISQAARAALRFVAQLVPALPIERMAYAHG